MSLLSNECRVELEAENPNVLSGEDFGSGGEEGLGLGGSGFDEDEQAAWGGEAHHTVDFEVLVIAAPKLSNGVVDQRGGPPGVHAGARVEGEERRRNRGIGVVDLGFF